MLFRNSINVLMENFKNVYRIMAYKLIVSLITSALCCVIVLPGLLDILSSAPVTAFVAEIKKFFPALFAADAAALATIKDNLLGADGILRSITNLLVSQSTGIVLSVIGCLGVLLLKRFIDTLCYFSIGDILNDRMSSYSETPFFSSFVANLGKASRFALFYVPVTFLFDLVCVLLGYLLISYVNLFLALFLFLLLTVLVQTTKLTFTGRIMPAMTADDKGLFESFHYVDETEKKQRTKLFSNYLVAVYTVLIVNVVAAICTLGSALLLTVPASYLLFICVQYVNYYTIKGKKYFITYDSIASNPDRGDREHFFDYIEETASANERELTSEEKISKEEK